MKSLHSPRADGHQTSDVHQQWQRG